MSGTVFAFRPAGQTIALSVVATSHAAVPILLNTNDLATFVTVVNTGTVAVAVRVSVAGTAASLPVDGTPGDWVIAGSNAVPITIPLPSPTNGNPCQITAIGAGAGPTLIYATPVVMQH